MTYGIVVKELYTSWIRNYFCLEFESLNVKLHFWKWNLFIDAPLLSLVLPHFGCQLKVILVVLAIQFSYTNGIKVQ